VVASGPGNDVTAPNDEFEICVAAVDVCKAGSKGAGSGQFANEGPSRVAEDKTGRIYTVEPTGNFRVQRFTLPANLPTPQGEFAAAALHGSQNLFENKKDNTTEIAVDDAGNVYAVKAFPIGTGTPPVTVPPPNESKAQQRILKLDSVSEAVTEETIDGALTQAVMAVRLKVEDKKVSEIETFVTREKEQKTFYNPKALLATADQDWKTPLPAAARKSREYMNDVANKYFSAFTKDKVEDGPYAEVCHRWEGGLQTTLKTPKCSPQGMGLFINHTHRRFPVTDLELGITAGFMNFGGALPDVHIFKFNEKGEVYLINAVFGGRLQGDRAVWPDEGK
jgi:hypothetical protein